MKSFLLVFLAVLFVSSVCAEDIVTPDGYLGRWSLDVWTGVSHNEATYYNPSAGYSNFNNWMGGLNVMRPLSRFATLYMDLSYIDMGHISQIIDSQVNRQAIGKIGVRFYVR